MSAGVSQTWGEFLVQIQDVKPLWSAQPTYIIVQSFFVFAGILTLLHALKKGGRWPYFWLGTLLHGIYADNFWHFILPEFDNFWHSQTPLMFLGGRQPLHIILLYPVFIYNAAYAVSQINLPKYAQPFAVGLLTVLIDLPYDIVSVKYVHWTWHDTDPNIFDRHYWVPWNSYYFHATFAASFYFFFHFSREWFAPKIARWSSASKAVEWKSLLVAVLIGMPGGILMFVPIYHPLHDTYKIHSEVTFFLLFSIFSVIILSGLLSEREKIKEKLSGIDYLLLLQLFIHYAMFFAIVILFNPEDERSLGLHEPVGPCTEKTSLVTPFGQRLFKRKYLCPDDYDEKYFDFHCTQKPKNGDNWYLICGTPFE
ncbi:hypothetical protein KGM_206050 [Danaus plexippus plexippus]|uniref:DUF7802 domain-containing protein n=1 Tax=Danaus plexippus plexippus TaxID=278856 RepID=A0A212EGI7_DANPL|nr:hypothetical protein KGM_206050 [Danaus plexippus plexippus]